MHSIWADRRLATLSVIAILGLFSQSLVAQRPAPPSSGAGSIPSAGSTGRNTTGSIPSTFPNSNPGTASPTMTRPIFLSGKVMFDDGTQPNSDIRIERVCGGIPRLEGHADSKGRFSFQLGQNPTVDTDASDPGIGGLGGGRQSGQMGSSPGGFGSTTGRNDQLWNCELRASYPGYRSDLVELATRRSLDDPDVGTIVLHRLVGVQGSTLSVTSAMAPKAAQKAYEKGMQLAAKGKTEEAEKRLLEATDTYPKYAIAWFALGQVQQKEGKTTEARKSYAAAIAADKKYVSPYDQLARLSANEKNWQDTADYSKQVIQLNPVEFPDAFWVNAIANYNLKRPDDAEKSARELLKVDTAHRYPEAENMLGELFLEKGNYPEAATHLKAYLTLAPNAKNADAVKQVLAKLDQANPDAAKK